MRIPPLIINIMLESNPLKSIMLVGRLAVPVCVKEILFVCEPWSGNPAAETVLRTLVWRLESLSAQESSSPEECFMFTDADNTGAFRARHSALSKRRLDMPGDARVCGSREATAIWSFRHCKPAACILGLTGANMRLSLICGFP